ncbi:MAG: aminotransferase class III-fold pyridoxal phosphate-dependent enzyme [Chloroflexi bacterium]|nr:aminotransferase class III-fold pyridoxal phosphate-dependent enzyme [Chloroflexota bacterium]MYD17463.1 aminotransferase class III-fold pyridoxal phosphate-dependent enzyme [Chloroflexota bacterium]
MSGSTAIDREFLEKHAESARRAEEARTIFPGGVTHDARHFDPFGITVDRAVGAQKWDADGNEYIDYVMGHGALIFGHSHPYLVEAVTEQVARGTHMGGSSELERRWAQAIKRLLPGAEKVRFTSSGTEATMMAVRLARAATGRDRLLRLRHHFHGWNDSVFAAGRTSAGPIAANGQPTAMQELISVFDQTDVSGIAEALETREYAAVILEPTGYSWGTCPLDPSVPQELRELTERTGTTLIFDEVVTGFRASSGGVQERIGVRPDLTTLAKIAAGGLPGGAVVGRADLLDQISFDAGSGRVAHPGTFNANPLSAVAGERALRAIAEEDPLSIASERAAQLSRGLNRALLEAEAPGCAWADASMVHIVLGQNLDRPEDGVTWNWDQHGGAQATLPGTPSEVAWPFRRALINHGVDLMGMGALVSCVHTESQIDSTIDRFSAALSDLRRAEIL